MGHRATLVLWAAVLSCCLGGPASAATTASASAAWSHAAQQCLGCHDDPGIATKDGRSLTVAAKDFAASAHREIECAACHQAALGVEHPKNALGPVSPQVCQGCHGESFKSVSGTAHGRNAGSGKAIADCTACHHDIHRVRPKADPTSAMSPVNQIRNCGACHGDMMGDYEGSAHARALLKMGLVESAPSCSSCHGTHDIRAAADRAASTSDANAPAMCGKCHSGVLGEWRESVHGTLWARAVADQQPVSGPVCTTCHASHKTRRGDAAAFRNDMARRCGNCHAEVYQSFRDTFHGQAAAVSDASVAFCVDCHTPHRSFPASDPRSSVAPGNLIKTCGNCHQDVNASFVTFDPHADPTDPKRDPWLFAVWVAMTGLLLGLFGFFGVHDSLWLQRTVVGKLRGEFGAVHARAGPYFRRFNSGQIALHVAIVLSFLLCAATGLPLKYADARWAPGLIALFGGREAAGALHRLGALVTFGYFAWHLAAIAYGWLVRKERGYFWGPRSMVPQPRDVRELWAMLKYFLYLAPRPKFDRFTYWEKFDYLGVFWGVAVIGVSGLVLWMPALATRIMPGWGLNAAHVIHSDEALLATGFIFVFHFFHTHLRPESFPMDTVVFTGRVPLEALKEERPLEYERLVATGQLEGRLAPAPTAAGLRVAYVFGFATLAIGIVLVAFIFWAILANIR